MKRFFVMAITLVIGLVILTGCDEEKLYRVLWNDFTGLNEKDVISVDHNDEIKTLTYDEYPDGGFTPQYEITAISVKTQGGTSQMDSSVDSGTKEQTSGNVQDETEKSDVSIPGFSYAEDCAIYVVGEPGVKTSGFVNTNETDVNSDNVTEIAKHECTIEYDSTKVYYDTIARIWKVNFYTKGMAGGGQTVYLDSNGKTVLVVYGE